MRNLIGIEKIENKLLKAFDTSTKFALALP